MNLVKQFMYTVKMTVTINYSTLLHINFKTITIKTKLLNTSQKKKNSNNHTSYTL